MHDHPSPEKVLDTLRGGIDASIFETADELIEYLNKNNYIQLLRDGVLRRTPMFCYTDEFVIFNKERKSSMNVGNKRTVLYRPVFEVKRLRENLFDLFGLK